VSTKEAYYRTIKANVDSLKLIQVGVTISDEKGNYPPDISTWQFNLKFDLNSDQYANDSIALLSNSGINFEMLASRGISVESFGEYLLTSGLILNDDIHWVSFHGIYDFAYFLKIITNLPLPENEGSFFELLKLYFPNYYDIRSVVKHKDSFRGSLSKLGQELEISRIGTQHQAGSDSLITAEIFFKLKNEFLSEETIKNEKNKLFGIGGGNDDTDFYQNNTTYYTSNVSNFKPNISTTNPITKNSSPNFSVDYSNLYQQNMLNIQYNYLRNNQNYFQGGAKNFAYPVNGYNQIGVGFPPNKNNVVNCAIMTEEIKKKSKGIVED